MFGDSRGYCEWNGKIFHQLFTYFGRGKRYPNVYPCFKITSHQWWPLIPRWNPILNYSCPEEQLLPPFHRSPQPLAKHYLKWYPHLFWLYRLSTVESFMNIHTVESLWYLNIGTIKPPTSAILNVISSRCFQRTFYPPVLTGGGWLTKRAWKSLDPCTNIWSRAKSSRDQNVSLSNWEVAAFDVDFSY